MDLCLTATNNHNGKIGHELHFLLVIDARSKNPLYFCYNAGNIPNVVTLSSAIAELKLMKVDVGMVILDAGYSSNANLLALYGENIYFLTRLSDNLKICKT
jgi:hypothetical protein